MPSQPSITLLIVFGVTTLALAFGVPLLLLRERVDKPWRFGVIALVLYLGIGFGARALLLSDVRDADAIAAAYAGGELTADEHDASLVSALEIRAQSSRTGMGLGLMAAIGFAWIVRIVAGRRLQQAATAQSLRAHIVGDACAICDDVIAMELEGKHCALCSAPLHRRCAARHRASAHPPRAAKTNANAKTRTKTNKRSRAPRIDLEPDARSTAPGDVRSASERRRAA